MTPEELETIVDCLRIRAATWAAIGDDDEALRLDALIPKLIANVQIVEASS